MKYSQSSESQHLDNLSSSSYLSRMNTTLSVGEFKARFSEALETVRKGGTVSVTYGRGRRPIALFTPVLKKPKRSLGVLKGKMTVEIIGDWELTDESFLQL
jgi:antitoxin (DNA-binding transcriptional repressor) of toxin-antitoxin stability system